MRRSAAQGPGLLKTTRVQDITGTFRCSLRTTRKTPHDCMAEGAAVIVFVKLPVPGKVKTRLAAGIGIESAAKFYKACAERAVHTASRSAPCHASQGHGHGATPQLETQHVYARAATWEQPVRLHMQARMQSSPSLSGSGLLRGCDPSIAGKPCSVVAHTKSEITCCAGCYLRAAGGCARLGSAHVSEPWQGLAWGRQKGGRRPVPLCCSLPCGRGAVA